MKEQEVRAALEVLKRLNQDGAQLEKLSQEVRVALTIAAGELSRPSREALRLRNRQIHTARKLRVAAADKQLRKTVGIRQARQQTVFAAPAQIEPIKETPQLQTPRSCYICKQDYTQLHFFYDSLCGTCGELNYQKRFQTASLEGQVALITGSRLKIGYQAALMMLRAGAHVIATTRFPVDAARRFARESDFSKWQSRLEIHGLDLRHTPSVELFTSFVKNKHARLDILINNAAQTVRRPAGFYHHLMEWERAPLARLSKGEQALLQPYEEHKRRLRSFSPSTNLPVAWRSAQAGIGVQASAELSQIPYAIDDGLPSEQIFPQNQLDADLQQIDLRHMNSWRLGLDDVDTMEMFEVQLVNSIAPFVLCSRLAPLMRQNPTGQKHIVNVTAMEGKFSRYTKTDKHPHTNMAKAALNMMTYTSARDLVKDGVYMNAVDTGWVTDEDPAALSSRKQDNHDFHPPLDIVDGAARVCDPFFHGILSGEHWCGKFLKDYVPTDW